MSAQLKSVSLDHYMELVLRYHPYRIITKGDDIWNNIMSVPEGERLSWVVENEEWTMGFDCKPIQSLSGIVNGYRVWNRKDWEMCDNRRQEAVKRIDASQAAYRANIETMKVAVRQSMLATGVTDMVWSMMEVGMNDVMLKDMYNALMANKSATTEQPNKA